MALPVYNGFSLQDDSYITTDIEYRTWPTRDLSLHKLARKPGMKLTSEEFSSKEINMRGHILGVSSADLQQKIDSLNTELQKPARLLQMQTDRYYTATVTNVAIGDPHYAQDAVPFEINFTCADPFSYGSTMTAQMTVASGEMTQNFTVQISGSYFVEPSIQYVTPAGTGGTTTSGIHLQHLSTGEYISWSGSGDSTYIPYGGSLSADYKTYKILYNTLQQNHIGVFSRWEPGSNTLQIIFGGNTVGGTLTISYAPRYL